MLVGGAVAFVTPRIVRARSVRRLARELGEGEPGERIRIASALLAEGLRPSAGELLLLVRTDHEPEVLTAVARAVLAAPPVARPSANVRELVQWATEQTGA